MTRAIVLAAVLGALGVAAAWSCRDAPPAREAVGETGADLAAASAASVATGLPLSGPGRPSSPNVPPGVLSRAADARALERAPACPPVPRVDAARCPPGTRDVVEIEWEAAREP